MWTWFVTKAPGIDLALGDDDLPQLGSFRPQSFPLTII